MPDIRKPKVIQKENTPKRNIDKAERELSKTSFFESIVLIAFRLDSKE